MSRIRSKNTAPELVVRKILTQNGVRYRLHVKKFPGNPDIVIRKFNQIIFINGCFWHQHKECRRSNIPKSNQEYWEPKLRRNIDRQKEAIKELKEDKWMVFIVWECETRIREIETLTKKLKKLIAV